ncbi:MAG: hypothetical protein MR902_08715 [Campylobacter sp.]|nr:hypothetical protein [Campylobacter sp.]
MVRSFKFNALDAVLVLDTIKIEVENINKNFQCFAFLATKDGEIVVGPDECKSCKTALNIIG